MEIWKEYHGYFVSDSGFVIGERYGIMKPVINKDGYYQCLLIVNGVRKNIVLHRLVALCFIPNPNNYPIVNHLDGNKLNCAKSNLEWNTVKGNAVHAVQIGLCDSKGEKNNNNTYSEQKVTEVKRLLIGGVSSRKIAKDLNISRSAIQHIKKGRTWSHLAV